ncbi:LysR substrate-binding domain-containing protein [Pseudomonas sp. LB3P38]|uniref:LysR substrate-binding domain-containing protein n=1 Tax=Pseudomonas lyxosi TaxID=3398358 RepID=UPI0039F0D1CE
MRIEPLPPLHNLVAFEAAARHRSFTRAATELHLTQSAVSRQIAQLEAFLGRALFRRENRIIHLTTAGESYYAFIHQMLGECAQATSELMTHNGAQELTIACSSGVAMLWLGPMLGHFTEAFPNIDVRLRVVDSLDSLARTEFDIAIYFSRSSRISGLDSRRLFGESVGAYCSPTFLSGRRLEPSQLVHHRLLVLEDGQRQWLSWQDWFGLLGVNVPVIEHRLTSNYYAAMIDMAVAGRGVIMGWEPIIDRLVDSGALVPACDSRVDNGGAYYLLHPSDQMTSRAARSFEDWLSQLIIRQVGQL